MRAVFFLLVGITLWLDYVASLPLFRAGTEYKVTDTPLSHGDQYSNFSAPLSLNDDKVDGSIVRRSPAPGWFSSNATNAKESKSYMSKMLGKVGLSSRTKKEKKQEVMPEQAKSTMLGNYFYGQDWKPNESKSQDSVNEHQSKTSKPIASPPESPPEKGMLGKLIYGDNWEPKESTIIKHKAGEEAEKSAQRQDSTPTLPISPQETSDHSKTSSSKPDKTISDHLKSSEITADSVNRKKKKKTVKWKEDHELKRIHEYSPSSSSSQGTTSSAPTRSTFLSKMKSFAFSKAEKPELKKAKSWNGQSTGGSSFRWSHTGLEPVESATSTSTQAENETHLAGHAKDEDHHHQDKIDKGKKILEEDHLPESSRQGESKRPTVNPTKISSSSHQGQEKVAPAIEPEYELEGAPPEKKKKPNWMSQIKKKMKKSKQKDKKGQDPAPIIDIYQLPPYTNVIARAKDPEVLEGIAKVHAKDREPANNDWWMTPQHAQVLAEKARRPYEEYIKEMKWNLRENPYNVEDYTPSPSPARNRAAGFSSPPRSSISTPQSPWTPTTFGGFSGQIISSSSPEQESPSQKGLLSSDPAPHSPFTFPTSSPVQKGHAEISEVQSSSSPFESPSHLRASPISPIKGVPSKERFKHLSSEKGRIRLLNHLSDLKEKEYLAARKKEKKIGKFHGQIPKQKENPFIKDIMQPEHQQRLRAEWMKNHVLEKNAKKFATTKEELSKEHSSTPDSTSTQYVDKLHFMDSLWSEELEVGRAKEREREREAENKKKPRRSWNLFKGKNSKVKKEDDSSFGSSY